MPKPFRQLTLQQFADELARFRFTRTVRQVHMHHTESPRKRDYTGLDTIEGMFRHHTRVRDFNDIAQHLSIAPDGTVWTGRDWNKTPASATGHNTGVFMFETIGNFDRGQERLEGKQLRAVIEVIARVQLRLGLPVESLHFHREFSTKTCPGTGITRAEILDAVRRRRAELGGARDLAVPTDEGDELSASRTRSAVSAAGGGADGGAVRPFDARELEPVTSGDLDDVREDDEADEDDARERDAFGDFDPSLDVAGRGGLTPAQLDALRPHVVNLRQGRFSGGGAMETTSGDVDAIFDEHLPRAMDQARGRSQPLRILFYAHGGLTSEARGLQYAHEVVSWWRDNHVYPIFFVWETGIWDALAQLLGGRRDLAAARGLDDISDRVLEEVARRAGGPRIWGAMKYSAERAVGSDGGARYVAKKLAGFCRGAGDNVEVHAAGHSAGAVFHSYFVPAAREAGAPAFRTVSFLAPAIRVDAFLERMQPVLGKGRGVDELTIFTMRRSFEEADNCGSVYRKSLLYLISNALEVRRGEPILGLETSIRGNASCRRLLGLEGPSSGHEAVWSTTDASTGRNASRSTSHGGFDNDAATMESVLRRVLDVPDTQAVVPFPASASRDFTFEETRDGFASTPGASVTAPAPHADPQGAGARPSGTMRALCVGIDAYLPPNRLSGCVNDARRWAGELGALGFHVDTLLDEQATERGIKAALERLIRGSRPGDVLVFQYSGHGTQIRDADSDDEDGKDEALVPVDFEHGGLVLDDEQFEIFSRVPEGVALTCFYDCCHSGSMARAALASLVREAARGMDDDVHFRFIEPTPQMLAAYHARKAERRARGLASRSQRTAERLNATIFSACQDWEVAMERGGAGVFTGHASRLLRAAWDERVPNREFYRRVVDAFGAGSQNPVIDGSRDAQGRSLLRALDGVPPARANGHGGNGASGAHNGLHLPWNVIERLVQGLNDAERGDLRRLLDESVG